MLFPARAQEDDRITRKFLNNVVQLTITFSNGDVEHGFGFVVGERDDMLYIVTANHVVRKDNPDVTTDKIRARFEQDKGNFYDAKLLNLPAYHDLDIAFTQ